MSPVDTGVQEWSQDCKLSCLPPHITPTPPHKSNHQESEQSLYLWQQLVMVLKEEQGIISFFFPLN